ncbi:RNA polymerase sigma factor [Pseudobacter ginsenosidimutans]|uniref:RNA polymerase sigma-70 factor (ECF subfamily) n=1 Tax=Pseudobacter ginsenosidimutans TaxID=661488 RepID=A0A4Q7MYH9_9BACT|nr:RNA polymerase sigma-70 factor [Pseudobacter ginsenosidimutans]QEC42924.1 RNA polymerase sigma-70 factor [Pseudobacter ginsenosidimutans]RZS74277.1 RNA polymerase sigma-70 factor (ECF subfamily) [Pseudobacter ginsenosidimutans]
MQDRSLQKHWFKQIAEGDETAFRSLFETYWDHLYTVAMLLTKSETLSEDIVQETFLKVWNKRRELPEVDKPEGYLFIIARNQIYNLMKQQQREIKYRKYVLDWFEAANETPENDLLFKESSQLLHRAIGQLSSHQQTVYKLTREQGLSYEETARTLNISTSTVRNHMVNSLKIIREYLKTHTSPLVFTIAMLETLK